MNTSFNTVQVSGNSHFFLTAEPIENGLVAVHLHAENLPKDFLGVAFHLPITGGQWSFEGTELVGDWALLRQNLFTLTSFRDADPDELIFGLSVKGGAEFLPESFQNGPVATFFLKVGTGDYFAEFTDAVLSVQEQGSRVDLTDVQFDGVLIGSGMEKGESSTSLVGGRGVYGDFLPVTQELFGTQETDFPEGQPGFVKVLGANVLAQNSYETVFQVYWVTFFFALILFLGVGLAYICHRLLQRKR
ncbi:hypothetical protein IT413_05795 [Candidatus Peregrinibacteria bacterium]|nr:hypothetical protein [Candidatus Peregrinibacteria bacterium]